MNQQLVQHPSFINSNTSSHEDTFSDYDTFSSINSDRAKAIKLKRVVQIFKKGYEARNQKWCTIRLKTLFILGSLFIVLIVIFCSVVFGAFPVQYVNIESGDVNKVVSSVISFLSVQSRALRVLSINNANAGYSYDFMMELRTTNNTSKAIQDFIDGSYSEATFTDYFNVAAYYYSNGTQIFQAGFDLVTKKTVELPESMNQLRPDVDLFAKNMNDSQTNQVGFITSTNGDILYAMSRPISRDGVNIDGFMIFGYLYSTLTISQIADATSSCITMMPWDDPISLQYLSMLSGVNPTIPSDTVVNWDFDFINPTLMDTQNLQYRMCSKNIDIDYSNKLGLRVMTFLVMKGVYQNQIFFFRIDYQRSNMILGMSLISVAFAILFCCIVVTVVIILTLIDVSVLRRIAKLKLKIEEITKSQDTHARLQIKSNDEFGVLAKCIDVLLKKMDDTNKNLVNQFDIALASEMRSKAVMKTIKDFIVCVDIYGNIQDSNPAFNRRFLEKHNASKSNIEVNISNFLKHPIEKLVELSQTGQSEDSSLVTRFGEVIPVTVFVSSTKLEGNVTIDALVVVLRTTSPHETRQEIKESDDFEKLNDDPVRKAHFLNFCKNECSTENIMFLNDVDVYKRIKNSAERFKKQTEIISRYLQPLKLNLSAYATQVVLPIVLAGYAQVDLFDKLAEIVKVLIVTDTYSRFTKLERTGKL
ncbi:regulator of G-protein signaling [Acrasis kona]|uniref:Regulator of G-protein signaling n=1 Tax=Acrasis kona TaxID=1008807 RepID=A0AAW2Z9B5_9EUKA